jgi:hypothetical protein
MQLALGITQSASKKVMPISLPVLQTDFAGFVTRPPD